MPSFIDELTSYVHMSAEDVARLATLHPLLSPAFPEIAEQFYAAVWADPKAPTSRALALMFAIIGILIIQNVFVQWGLFGIPRHAWLRTGSIGEALAFIAGFEWSIRVRRTELRGEPSRTGEGMPRVAQGLMAIYGLV